MTPIVSSTSSWLQADHGLCLYLWLCSYGVTDSIPVMDTRAACQDDILPITKED